MVDYDALRLITLRLKIVLMPAASAASVILRHVFYAEGSPRHCEERKRRSNPCLYYGSPRPLTRPRDDASRQLAMTATPASQARDDGLPRRDPSLRSG